MNTTAPFQAEHYYHVYNRTNNNEILFKKSNHRSKFLSKYKAYISPFVYTHSYALLDNHFHFSLQVKNKEEILSVIDAVPKKDRTLAMWNIIENQEYLEFQINILLTNQFKNLLISYAKGLNQEMNRVGSLFQKRFKRSIFNPTAKFKRIQYYIHHNARFHDIVHQFTDFPFHSFLEIILGESSIIDIPKVLEHYNGIDDFKNVHTKNISKTAYLNFSFESLLAEVNFGSSHI
jgi:hypothetical protein